MPRNFSTYAGYLDHLMTAPGGITWEALLPLAQDQTRLMGLLLPATRAQLRSHARHRLSHDNWVGQYDDEGVALIRPPR